MKIRIYHNPVKKAKGHRFIHRMVRGGAWNTHLEFLIIPFRDETESYSTPIIYGFRIVRNQK